MTQPAPIPSVSTQNANFQPQLTNIYSPSVPVVASATHQSNFLTPGMNNNSINSWSAFNNPFTPPSLSKKQLKKIEDREFVDFIDLLPENQTADIGLGIHDRPIIEIDEDTGSLVHKDHKVKKAKVSSFHRWSVAWTIFAQAHLHYHPEDFFELFQYHAIMVQHINTYRYDACYRYDCDVRLKIQAESKMPLGRRTVFWGKECEAIRNRRLINHPLPVCDNCRTPGHHERTCRKKDGDKDEASSTQRNSQQSNNNHNNNYRWQAPQQPPFRANWKSGNNNKSGKVPPSQKPCWNFNHGVPCEKPQCMFLHVCHWCGDPRHKASACPDHTSTNFIPVSH